MISDIEIVQLAPQHAVVVSEDVTHDQIGPFVGRAFGTVMAALQGQGLAPTGMPFARYDMTPNGFHIDAGFPCDGFPGAPGVNLIELPAGPAVRLTFTGPYDAIVSAYQAVESWMKEQNMVPTSGPWESYLDGPEVAEPRTVVTWPCRPA